MKIKIEIECTPEEARAFLGLPDVAPMQAALLAEMQSRMKDAVALPSGLQGWDTMQKAFWAQAHRATGQGEDKT